MTESYFQFGFPQLAPILQVDQKAESNEVSPMNINAALHTSMLNLGSTAAAGGQEPSARRQEVTAEPPVEQKAYDFKDISRSELNNLWRKGEIDMRLPPLILPSNGLDLTKDTKAQMEAVYDEKIDVIQHFQKRIEFQNTQSITESNQAALAFYEDGLNMLINLNGETTRSRVNVTA